MRSDDGFGAMENSSGYHLRVYKIRLNFETAHRGSGKIHIESFIELHDLDEKIPFTSAIISAVSAAYGRKRRKGTRSADPVAGLRESRRRRPGTTFAFVFVTIEDVFVFDRHHIGVLNDKQFPVHHRAPRRFG